MEFGNSYRHSSPAIHPLSILFVRFGGMTIGVVYCHDCNFQSSL
ncbi:MAG: hypothetical protein RMJ28_07635 [Nitrososphaerota archaeon]|nr:hypothetical protein [Nitrososphaerota archaeon]